MIKNTLNKLRFEYSFRGNSMLIAPAALLFSAITFAACFFDITNLGGETAILKLFNYNILLLPTLTFLFTLFDGFLIFRFKFSSLIGLIWLFILYYVYSRLYKLGYRGQIFTPCFYTLAISAAALALLPFLVRYNDNSALISFKKYDLIWFLPALLLYIWLMYSIYKIQINPNNHVIFDEVLEKALNP